MEIKRFNKKKSTTGLKSKLWYNWGILFAIINFLLFCMLSSFISETDLQNYYVSRIKYFCRNQVKHLKAWYKADPEQIRIDIEYKDFQKLAYKREIALAHNVLISSSQDYVPAIIGYKDKSAKAEIRLKGDWAYENLSGDKWSFRIKLKRDNTLFGMRCFSIHHPRGRNYIYEWIFHQALKREGILSLRYEFIKVILNGKNLGIYALEEHFDKQLMGHNQKREGIIIKFNEDIYWKDRTAYYPYDEISPTILRSEFASYIDAFKMGSISENPFLYKQFIVAKNLLESFRRDELPTHKVFDVKKLAKYFAISGLINSSHAIVWHNLRFYYNPITSLLEPIGFDANVVINEEMNPFRRIIEGEQLSFRSKVFSDLVFFEEFVKTSEKISDAIYLDELFLDIDKDLKKNLNIIYSEFFAFCFSKNNFYRNQKHIRAFLNPVKGIHAYFHKSFTDRIELELGNIQSIPVEILNIVDKNSVVLMPIKKNIIWPRLKNGLVDYKNVSFIFPKGFVWSEESIKNLAVRYRLLGTGRIRQESIFPWSYLKGNFVKNDFMRQKPNIYKFKFLVVNEKAKRISIKPGVWNINQNLIIPGGYILTGKEGTKFNLLKSAKILSYSPIKLLGSEENPFIICSPNSTGQGMMVMNAGQESILKYVIFNNLSNPLQEGWELSGAVTFYNSPVSVQYCRFLNNNSEDALNLIHSEFTIRKTFFSNTLLDAIDIDFSKGEITNCSFVDCGNDAIDVAGSVIRIQDVFIKGVGDKGLSVGENSRITVKQIDIKNAKMAVASKDMSEVIVEQIKISNCEIGLAVYQKKSEFGSGFMEASRLNMDKVSIPYLVEDKSELKIDGELIKSNKEDIREFLYDGGNVKKSGK